MELGNFEMALQMIEIAVKTDGKFFPSNEADNQKKNNGKNYQSPHFLRPFLGSAASNIKHTANQINVNTQARVLPSRLLQKRALCLSFR